MSKWKVARDFLLAVVALAVIYGAIFVTWHGWPP
jgi:hypothetical protein